MAKKEIKKDYIYALGRRRTSTARVRLYNGKGQNNVNGKPIEEYFPGALAKDMWSKPFKVVDASEMFYATVRVLGGGVRGQLEATVHGLSKALAKAKVDEFRKPLKTAGLLTRDSRIRQRRMVGTGGKARRAKQSPKR
jgi:small subunit ribosomal protein S9